jgi:hypothetical protein
MQGSMLLFMEIEGYSKQGGILKVDEKETF